jgi:hypothetical protein
MNTYKIYIEDTDGSERLGCIITTSTKFVARKLAVAQLGKKIKITSIEKQVTESTK